VSAIEYGIDRREVTLHIAQLILNASKAQTQRFDDHLAAVNHN
jgi:hypothetical protein